MLIRLPPIVHRELLFYAARRCSNDATCDGACSLITSFNSAQTPFSSFEDSTSLACDILSRHWEPCF
jgi:hypothetical protein